MSIKRVVVRGTNWVGDALMTIPALRALRRVLPDAHITLVIRPGTKGIFSGVDFVDQILGARRHHETGQSIDEHQHQAPGERLTVTPDKLTSFGPCALVIDFLLSFIPHALTITPVAAR